MQIELLKLHSWLKDAGEKLVIVFEGRDAAGKGGTIRRLTEHLNPRGTTVVALEKPNERGQKELHMGGRPRAVARHASILKPRSDLRSMGSDVGSRPEVEPVEHRRSVTSAEERLDVGVEASIHGRTARGAGSGRTVACPARGGFSASR